ncbi:MAG: filamentous hemagglutinin N-terminal domain-containing protein, partial [Akkermansiaceae bacterium]|nr:filamentous hemagglutinin N-terminal domain-containing protein [Akkermansiaceae bacterium]
MNTPLDAIRRSKLARFATLAFLMPGLGLAPPGRLWANPSGGTVTSGIAEIGDGFGGHLRITQSTGKAIINWEDFSISAGELTEFVQPGAGAAILNRVISGNPSAIHGALRANGKVFVINPNGIVVGPTGTIDVGGLVLSTLDVSDASFLSGGDMIFRGSGNAGVQNFGRINAIGGDVFLLGKSVVNTGSITASGTVGIGAGEEVLITANPDANGERVFVKPVGAGGGGVGIDNSGTIEGAAVELKAHGNLYALAINNSGSIRATGASRGGGGVFLRAPGGQVDNSGTIQATLPGGDGGRILIEGAIVNAGGTIDASATGQGKGGEVTLLGETINVPDGANILANGGAGGSIRIGGGPGEVKAGSINVGAGANISANGSSGPGGSVTVTGGLNSQINVGGNVSATGADGFSGGRIVVNGTDVSVAETGALDATGGVGGVVSVRAVESVTVDGAVSAAGTTGRGGMVGINSYGVTTVGETGAINTGGATNGGTVTISASGTGVTNLAGAVSADGATGNGGLLTINGGSSLVLDDTGVLSASGATAGGRITADSARGTTEFGATAQANASGGRAGQVRVSGETVEVTGSAAVEASGATGGGTILVGGGFQGRDRSMHNSDLTTVGNGAVLTADGLDAGSAGGNVVVWADGDTLFEGAINARGVARGGFAEVSGRQQLGYAGRVDLTATNGPAGTLLLDPTNGLIQANGGAHNTGAMPFIIDNVLLSADLDAGNNVIIATSSGGADRGDLQINDAVEWYQDGPGVIPGTLTLLAEGNIRFADDVRSAGSGGINIVAGWDGTTGLPASLPLDSGGVSFNMGAILATMNDGNAANDAAGLNDGSVFINGYNINGGVADVAEGIEVGSRFGDTLVATHDLYMRGSDTSGGNNDSYWAQLGFRDTGVEYDIGLTRNGERNEWWGNSAGNVRGKDYLTDLEGTPLNPTGGGAGQFLGAGHGATGDIVVQASGRIDARGGDDNHSYVQIGHGGTSAEGIEAARNRNGASTTQTTRDGFVIDSGDDGRLFFGASWRTNYIDSGSVITLSDGQKIDARVDGDISIEAGEDILIMAPTSFENGAGYTDLSNDQGSSSRYAKVGHGGLDNFGSYHGDISVMSHGATTGADGLGVAGSGIQVRAGKGSLNPAQIGHGGFHEGNRRTIYDQTSSGDITVMAMGGAVRVLGFNLLPREGNDNTGAIAAPNVQLLDTGTGTEYEFSNVQIGHGGWHRDNPTTGGVFTSPGPAILNAGVPRQNMQGDITVYAGGTVAVNDNMGYDAAGNWHEDLGPGFDPYNISGGDLVATRSVGIEVRAGNNGFAYGLIGHGGAQMRPDDTDLMPVGIEGDISVTAGQGSIMFIGGEEKRSERTWGYGRSYVQIGHGGWDVDARTAGYQGDVTVSAGQEAFASEGNIIFRTGRAYESFAQIGHGGYSGHGIITGDGSTDGMMTDTSSLITVNAQGNIEFTSRKAMPTDAIGLSAEFALRNATNEEVLRYINLGSGNVVDADATPQLANRGTSYDIDRSYAMIGHGGYDFVADNGGNYSLNNTVDVRAGYDGGDNPVGGAIRFTAGEGSNNFVQIGIGGYENGGDRDIMGADISVLADGDIVFDATNGGIMEFNQNGVGGSTDGRSTTEWSRGHYTFAQIGNGGYDLDGDFDGSITVKTTNGGNLHMLGANTNTQIFEVTNYVGNTVEGVTAVGGDGVRQATVGNLHTYTSLQEATMKARTFQLFHGNSGGAAATGNVGNIVPGTLTIDVSDAGGSDVIDSDAADGTVGDGQGLLIVNGDTIGAPEGNYEIGDVVGHIDYTTGVVTMYERVENNDGAFARNIDYQYDNSGNGGSATQAINDERTYESDSALRASQAYLGHGGIVAGTVSIVIDPDNNGNGRQVITDRFGPSDTQSPTTGILVNDQGVRVGTIAYETGRIIIEGIDTATADSDSDGDFNTGTLVALRDPLNDRTNPDEVVAHYNYTEGYSYRSYVQLGNGGAFTGIGGRNSRGHSGEIKVDVEGDIRMHGGAYQMNYAQIGHGGYQSQGWHGYQGADPGAATAGGVWGSAPLTDTADLDASPEGNITVTAGGILEMLSGRGINEFYQRSYSQLGHGGWDSDGHHQGNIRVTTGTGEISTAPGIVGGSGQMGGAVFTAGQTRDSYTQLGLGGFGARSARDNNDTGARGLTGIIDLETGGDILFTSGTLIDSTFDGFGSLQHEDGRLYSQLGHGGYDADIRHNGGTQLRGTGLGHNGDITVTSNNGSVIFQAGDASVNAPGSSTGLGNDFGIIHYTMLGHGGYSTQGDHSGDITVTAANDIAFNAGSATYDDSTDKRNFAMLGHGGDESDGENGARIEGATQADPVTVLDTITVEATNGDIKFIGGAGRRNWVQLGNGGFQNNGDHMANIDVTAGGNLWFIGGQGPETAMQIRGETGASIDNATWSFDQSGTALGWTPLRRNDIDISRRDFVITVNGIDYIANGASQIESDGDARRTAALIYRADTAMFDGNGKLDEANSDVVGEIDLRTSQVRFFEDIDPTDTFAYGTTYNVAGWGSGTQNNTADNNETINPQLAQAMQGSGAVGNTFQAFAYMNNTLGGITNVQEPDNAPFGDNIGIAASTFRLNVPDGTIVEDDGAGNLTVTNASAELAASGINNGDTVGSVNYLTGAVTLTSNVNPSGRQGVSLDYDTDRGVGSDISYAQLGNGGYAAGYTKSGANTRTDKSYIGDIMVNTGGDIRFHAGNGASAYAKLGHGGTSSQGVSSGDIDITAGGGLEFLGGLAVDETDSSAWAQLGMGGHDADGNHFGDINITAGGGLLSRRPGVPYIGDVAGSNIGIWFKAGDMGNNIVQLGHGGRDARSGENDSAAGSFGMNGDIVIDAGGDIAFIAGTGRENADPADGDLDPNENFYIWAQLGHGGMSSDPVQSDTNYWSADGTMPFLRTVPGKTTAGTEGAGDGKWGHFGDIIVRTTTGDISFMAGSTVPLDDRVDLDGNPLPISVGNAARDHLVSHGNGGGIYHIAQGGHGGLWTGGNAHGDIEFSSENGSVQVVGGMNTNDNDADRYGIAYIGHGAVNDQGHTGRSDESIVVKGLGATGNVLVAGGTGRQSNAKIGNGGGRDSDGTALGDIKVYAGNNVILQGGMALAREVTRIAEYQDLQGTDGGNGNDISEFNAFYGANGLGIQMMDEAAALATDVTGDTTPDGIARLMNGRITPGTVEFRIDDAGHTYDGNAAPHITDDGAGNLVTQAALPNGTPAGTTVGTIDYTTGAIEWTTAVIDNADDNPDIFINYATTTQIRNDAYRSAAMIGHGGSSVQSLADGSTNGGQTVVHPETGVTPMFANVGHTGDIDVRAGVDTNGAFTGSGGSIIGMGGNDQRAYVQIGHGGDDSIAQAGHAYRGDITLKADGDITFRGGEGLIDNFNVAWDFALGGDNASVPGGRSNSGITDISYAYAQVGHGGVNSDANNSVDNNSGDPEVTTTDTNGHSGDIDVVSNTGDITFAGGGVRGFGLYAQLGHGGIGTNGNHNGDISVEATAGNINFLGGFDNFDANNVEKRAYALLGHGGHAMTGNLEGDIDVIAGQSVNFSGGVVDSSASLVPFAAHVYVLTRTGNQDENHRNRNQGRQNFAQLGHGGINVYGDKTGNITVTAGDDIDFSGGNLLVRENGESDNSSNLSFAQLGHGGYFSWRHYRNNINPAGATQADDFNVYDGLDGTGSLFWPLDSSGNPLYDGFSGDIELKTLAGDVRFTGGNSHSTFAKVGHGGYETGGDHSGDITIDAAANLILNADIDLHGTAPGDAGSGNQTYAQVGHGGFYSDGEQSGNIDITVGGGITGDAGDSNSFAMIGHGGISSHGTSTAQWGSTNPIFRYGTNRGYRPGTRTGNIEVDAFGDIVFTGGNTDGGDSFVMIGHGGRSIAANPDPTGQYGDGHNGGIIVRTSDGKIRMQGGQNNQQFAMIGHGGFESFGNHGGIGDDLAVGSDPNARDANNQLDSDIVVEAATGVEMIATGTSNSGNWGSSQGGSRNFAQIGHGGWRSSFREVADMDGTNFYAKLQPYGSNFGGQADDSGLHPLMPAVDNPDGNYMGTVLATVRGFTGDISVKTTQAGGDILFIGPNEADGTLDHGGREAYVQLGHGGYRSHGSGVGDITVTSAGGITFQALQGTADSSGTSHDAFAHLGHGGFRSGGNHEGDINVVSEDSILFQASDSTNGANEGFVQLGHGGFDDDDDQGEATAALLKSGDNDIGNTGNIEVTVNNGDLEFLAGRDVWTFAQLGHGGGSTRDSHSGEISVDVSGGIRFVAGTDPGDTNPGANNVTHAMLGHGGIDSDGDHHGNIMVRAGSFAAGPEAGRGIVFRAGDHDQNFAQLGHGGDSSRTFGSAGAEVGLFGDIDVESDGDILFVAGTFNQQIWQNNDGRNYVQLGHGGYDVDVTQDGSHSIGNGVGHNGSIRVVANDGGIYFLGGDTQRAFEPSVGTGAGRFHYAQLGHGGYEARGDHWGSIEVRAGIAADGTVSVVNPNADIMLASGGDGGDRWGDQNSYAMIGMGGRTAQGNLGRAGDTISVMAGRDINLIANTGGPNNFVHLGNGGFDSRGDHQADIQVFAERNITLEGSQLAHNPGVGNGLEAQMSFGGSNTSSWNLDRAADGQSSHGNGNMVADLRHNWLIPGGTRVTIRDDGGNIIVVLTDSATPGQLVTDRDISNFIFDDTEGAVTIAAGTHVANMIYGNGSDIEFLRDMNPARQVD